MIARLVARLAVSARVFKAVMTRSVAEFLNNRGPLLSAAISYYVLLSIFPLAIFLVAISGLVLRDDELRAQAVDEIVSLLSLQPDAADSIASTLEGVASAQSVLGFLGLIGLVWTSSALMGAVRGAFSTIWGVQRRPFLRAKALDILLVLGVGLLVTLSLALTIVAQGVRRLSDGASDSVGPLGAGAHAIGWLSGTAAPVAITFVVFLVAYRVIPAAKPPLRDIWPGALLGALAFELLKVGFSFYLANFASYNVIYGSLGAVIAFMVFVYLSANLLLFGAEVISELGVARAEAREPRSVSDRVPITTGIRHGLRRLVTGRPPSPRSQAGPDAEPDTNGPSSAAPDSTGPAD